MAKICTQKYRSTPILHKSLNVLILENYDEATSTLSVRMDPHQAHIIEYSSTVELQMLIRIQLWELTSLFLKEYTYFLRSTSKEGMLRHTNISLALLLGTSNLKY